MVSSAVAHAQILGMWEAEAGGLSKDCSRGLHSEFLS